MAVRRRMGDGVRAALLTRAAAALLAAAVLFLRPGAVEARTLTVTGSETGRFARILLEFDQPTKVTARTTAGVIVLSFSASVTVSHERLTSELPNTLAQLRRDPDGTGFRLALVQPMRVSILEAGEKVFVDLLPQNWTGLPPSLPPDVVAEL